MAYAYQWHKHGLITADIPTPPATTNIVWTNNESTPIRLLYFTCKLVTTAAVADRMLQIFGHTGTFAFAVTPAAAVQTASKTRTYHFATCILGIDGGDPLQTIWAPLNGDFYLTPGDTLNTFIHHLQLSDQLSQLHIRYQQLLPSWL